MPLSRGFPAGWAAPERSLSGRSAAPSSRSTPPSTGRSRSGRSAEPWRAPLSASTRHAPAIHTADKPASPAATTGPPRCSRLPQERSCTSSDSGPTSPANPAADPATAAPKCALSYEVRLGVTDGLGTTVKITTKSAGSVFTQPALAGYGQRGRCPAMQCDSGGGPWARAQGHAGAAGTVCAGIWRYRAGQPARCRWTLSWDAVASHGSETVQFGRAQVRGEMR